MPFAFERSDKTAEKAIRRIAIERLEASRLLFDDTLARPALVHELRKNVKKTRAILRLVRPHFRGFTRENAALRDSARIISGLRDADVLIATFDRIATASRLSGERIAGIRVQLAPELSSDSSPDDRLASHREAISAVERRAKNWKISGKGFDALADGLERSWNAARTSMRHAVEEPSGEALHMWRKRVKDHWYHARLLAPIWPEMMRTHLAIAGTLGETLGEARDLAFLAEALDNKVFRGNADAATISALVKTEERDLLERATELGARFLFEPATALSYRWRGWWDLWRS